MKIENEVPPYERDGDEGDSSLTPEPESQADVPDVSTENGESGSLDEFSPVDTETETLLKPESKPPQKKQLSRNVFLYLFLILIFAGLSLGIYSLEKKRSKSLLEIEERLANLDSIVGALKLEDAAQTARNLALLQQEFQVFKKQTSESLAFRPSPVQEPPDPDKELPVAGELVATTQELIPDTQAENTPLQLDNLPTTPNAETASVEPFPLNFNSYKPPPGKMDREPWQQTQPFPASQTDKSSEESPGQKMERSKEVQKYIDFVESTSAELFRLVKKGSITIWDYLVDLLG